MYNDVCSITQNSATLSLEMTCKIDNL